MLGSETSPSRIGSQSQQTPRNSALVSMASSQNMLEVEMHELSEIQTGTLHDPSNELVRYPTTGGSASSVNQFATYFIQMSPVLPTHR